MSALVTVPGDVLDTLRCNYRYLGNRRAVDNIGLYLALFFEGDGKQLSITCRPDGYYVAIEGGGYKFTKQSTERGLRVWLQQNV